jgi:hypothetical protein
MATASPAPTPSDGKDEAASRALAGKSAQGAAGSAEAFAPDSGAVREFVLSGQLREGERRQARLEERLSKELSHLRAEITARFEALERHVQAETQALAAKLEQEAADRQSGDQQAAGEAQAARCAAAKELDGARQAAAKSEREVRQALLDASKSWSAELYRVHDELATQLSRDVHALEDGKVARASLAAMLGEAIVKLNAEVGGGERRFEA